MDYSSAHQAQQYSLIPKWTQTQMKSKANTKQSHSQLFASISGKYDQLKKCQSLLTKKAVSEQLISLCTEAEKQLAQLVLFANASLSSSQLFRYRTQITNIKNTAMQVFKETSSMMDRKNIKNDSSCESKEVLAVGPSSSGQGLSSDEKSRRVVRLIIEKQIKSRQLRQVSTEELQKLAAKMENNLQLIEKVKDLLHDQGDNLNQIEENITRAYDCVEEDNEHLLEAAELSFRNRLTNIRVGITGILAAIGYGILGLPGAIMGSLIGLFKTV